MRSEEFWKAFKTWEPKLAFGDNRRDVTFRKMFEHLDGFARPVVIVETGCLEEPDNWVGNGCSSIQFDKYVETHPGSTFITMDLSPVHCEVTRVACPHARVIEGDSVEIIKELIEQTRNNPQKIDLLYLDASHLDWNNETPAAAHHLNELYAVMPGLTADTLVVVDDSPALTDDFPNILVGGKGKYVADHAAAVGADLLFHEYQIGWTGMTRRPVPSTEDLRELVARARAYGDSGYMAAASAIYRVVLVIAGRKPVGLLERNARAEACRFFADTAHAKGKLGSALDWHRSAVVAAPDWTDYRLGLVKASYRLGLWEAARGEAERATRIAPEDYLTWKALGDVELEMENGEAARIAYDKEGELAPPDYLDWMLDRCGLAVDLEEYELAQKLCQRMMSTPNEKDAWHVLGMLAYRKGDHEHAIRCYDKALEMKARDLPQVHWNKSLALHSIGRYREGWKEHEWREVATHQAALSLPFRRFAPLPALRDLSKQLPPAVVHVHGEAGAGDNISCARYLRLLIDRGYAVRYETLGTMEKLFQDSFPQVQVIERAKDYPGVLGIEPFDFHCPIGSLPAVFGTDLDTVPWFGPYIKADDDLVQWYSERLERHHVDGLKIGVCWSSGIRLKEGLWMERYGRHKSMHFDDLQPLLLAGLGATFVSLQVGPERDQNRGEVLDILPEKPTWAETAALVANLDLVVCVDTGLAHLAGAMGKPVLLAMHPQGSWHFMVHREGASFDRRSPWYPNTLIYRAPGLGQWDSVVERIAKDLKTSAWKSELYWWPWQERVAAE